MVGAYFSFSQLLIIWAGNLPEEIPVVFAPISRSTPWRYIGIALILLQFRYAVFAVAVARSEEAVAATDLVACLLICMRLVDLIWVIAA